MAYATSAVFAELVLALQLLAVSGLADGAGDEGTEPGFKGSLCSLYDHGRIHRSRSAAASARRRIEHLPERLEANVHLRPAHARSFSATAGSSAAVQAARSRQC